MKYFFFLLCCCLISAPAQACRCRPLPLETYYHNAEIVFIARALKQTAPSMPNNRITLALQTIGSFYKGKAHESFSYTTPQTTAECGISFVEGQSYLLFGEREPDKDNTFLFHTCSGSRPFDPQSPSGNSDFLDAPATRVLPTLISLSRIHQVQEHGIGGVPLHDSIIGILTLSLDEKPLPLYQRHSSSSPKIQDLTSLSQVHTKEFAYEEPGAVVYERTGEWYRLKRSDNTYGWVQGPDQSGTFHPLSELLLRRLSYTTSRWDGMLWPDPGAGIPRRVDTDARKTTAIDIIKTTRIADSLWLYIRLHRKDPCAGTSKNTYQASGWIPAWNTDGELTTWFWSRGC